MALQKEALSPFPASETILKALSHCILFTTSAFTIRQRITSRNQTDRQSICISVDIDVLLLLRNVRCMDASLRTNDALYLYKNTSLLCYDVFTTD